MKLNYFYLLPIISIMLTLTVSAGNPTNKDSVTTKQGDAFSKKLKPNTNKDGMLMITRFDAFIDSINSTISDSMPFYDWITNDIHIRKFDFSKVTDTLNLVLNDSNDYYTPPFKGNITSCFGKRNFRYHYGMDIDLKTGDTVQAAFGGRVRISTYSKSYGNVVVVRHDNGLETIYAHLSKRLVDVDSVITTGTVLGLGGNTGHSYGSHLHFEVRLFDEPLDPRDIISFENYTTHCDTLAISKCNFAYKDELKLMAAVKYHRVRSGNTLGHIANKYGTSITKLTRLNGISRNSILQIGQRLRVN